MVEIARYYKWIHRYGGHLNMMKPDSIHHQRGMTAIGMLLVLVIAILISTMVIKLIPVYLEHYNVASVLTALKNDPQVTEMTDKAIRDSIDNRFSINSINEVRANQVKIIRDGGRVTSLSLDYEVRVHMFWNIDAVVHFNDDAEISH